MTFYRTQPYRRQDGLWRVDFRAGDRWPWFAAWRPLRDPSEAGEAFRAFAEGVRRHLAEAA